MLRQPVSNDSLLISTCSVCTQIRPFFQGAPLYFGTIAGGRCAAQNPMASMVLVIYERSLAEPVWLIIEKPEGPQ